MPKKCLYEVLGLLRTCSSLEVKKGYKQQALRWHPDKNAGDATAADRFKEVQEAYEVLSDPQERAWYDDNREEYIHGDMLEEEEEQDKQEPHDEKAEVVADTDLLAKWCNLEAFQDYSDGNNGFFLVYSTVFNGLHEQERTGREGDVYRPGFGFMNSGPETVEAFYTYWLKFESCRSFCHCDKYALDKAPSRIVKKLMGQKNLMERRKAKSLLERSVRQLTRWIQAKDPRTSKTEVQNGKDDKLAAEQGVEGNESGGDDQPKFFDCAACSKRFKSVKQMANHERSKKHKQAAERLRKKLQEQIGGESFEELVEVAQTSTGAATLEGQEGNGGNNDEGTSPKSKKSKAQDNDDEAQKISQVKAGGQKGTEESSVDAAVDGMADLLLESREEFEATDDFKKMNKTQRRKAIQQWEAENAFAEKALRKAGRLGPKVERKKYVAPTVAAKKHVTGGHNRAFRQPKKKKVIYGSGGRKGGKKGKGKSGQVDSD